MDLGDACMFGLRHFGWALQVFFLTNLAMTCFTATELVSTLRFYTECFSWPDLVRDLAILALRDHVLTAPVFVHYLKVYFDSYSIRDIIRLRFAVELLGFMLLISTFLGAWSTGLVIYF
ncbi:hypothetical protein MBLNU13_g00521t1 [Cladosporium sp. NU13]